NSPSNPTGIVMTQAEVDAAVDIARRHGLLILSDEIYEPFLYAAGSGVRGQGSAPASGMSASPEPRTPNPEPARLPSAALSYENTVILRGFSKSHAMTGWRLGYAAGPEAVIS